MASGVGIGRKDLCLASDTQAWIGSTVEQRHAFNYELAASSECGPGRQEGHSEICSQASSCRNAGTPKQSVSLLIASATSKF